VGSSDILSALPSHHPSASPGQLGNAQEGVKVVLLGIRRTDRDGEGREAPATADLLVQMVAATAWCSGRWGAARLELADRLWVSLWSRPPSDWVR
jgi:hypothetical protein